MIVNKLKISTINWWGKFWVFPQGDDRYPEVPNDPKPRERVAPKTSGPEIQRSDVNHH